MIEHAGVEAPPRATAAIPGRPAREGEAAGSAAQAHPPLAASGPWRQGKLIIGGLVIALAVGYLAVTGLRNASVYYVTPSELEARGAAAFDRPVRVGGHVVDGSIQRDDRNLVLRFSITDGTTALPVEYRGIVPDLFGYAKDGFYQDVVVEGRFMGSGTFEAQQLIVSHGAVMEAGTRTGSLPARFAGSTTSSMSVPPAPAAGTQR